MKMDFPSQGYTGTQASQFSHASSLAEPLTNPLRNTSFSVSEGRLRGFWVPMLHNLNFTRDIHIFESPRNH